MASIACSGNSSVISLPLLLVLNCLPFISNPGSDPTRKPHSAIIVMDARSIDGMASRIVSSSSVVGISIFLGACFAGRALVPMKGLCMFAFLRSGR